MKQKILYKNEISILMGISAVYLLALIFLNKEYFMLPFCSNAQLQSDYFSLIIMANFRRVRSLVASSVMGVVAAYAIGSVEKREGNRDFILSKPITKKKYIAVKWLIGAGILTVAHLIYSIIFLIWRQMAAGAVWKLASGASDSRGGYIYTYTYVSGKTEDYIWVMLQLWLACIMIYCVSMLAQVFSERTADLTGLIVAGELLLVLTVYYQNRFNYYGITNPIDWMLADHFDGIKAITEIGISVICTAAGVCCYSKHEYTGGKGIWFLPARLFFYGVIALAAVTLTIVIFGR